MFKIVSALIAFTPTGTAVYITAGDGIDALALGSHDLNGPVLLVPRGGSGVTAAVLAEIDRLAPDYVVAVGGVTAVTDTQLNAAAVAAGQ
ncbi:hypothetical protein [Ornithinimicrobium cerasi]|uniref:hypothetical protein n=1 Tax=Ornithinimicrobium cerasi TaxID=2248773 RepID=UPI000EFFD23D|nr:hypothetical protein [Ornithinimicrobium cerasi]